MAINGSGIRDTSRVLQISKTTIINIIRRKENNLVQVNPAIRILGLSSDHEVRLEPVCDAGRYHLALTLKETEIKASHWPIAIKYFQHYGIFCLKIKDAINDSPGCFFRFDRSSCR